MPTLSSTTTDFLRSVPLFSALEPHVLERIASEVHERRMPKGAAICRESEPCPGFWIVRHGSVNVFKVAKDGKMRILETCGPGECFGLVAVVDGGNVPANAETREPATVILVPRATILSTVDESPRFGLAIAAQFATRLRRTTCEVAAACLQSVRSRVAGLLVQEANEHGQALADGTVAVRLPGSQEELAHRVGTEREVFARALRSLRVETVIDQTRESVTIRDLERLRRIASS